RSCSAGRRTAWGGLRAGGTLVLQSTTRARRIFSSGRPACAAARNAFGPAFHHLDHRSPPDTGGQLVALGEYGTARYPSVAENHGLGKAGCCRMVCHADGVLRCALVGWLGLPAQSRVLPRRCYLLRLDDLVRRLPGARTNESQL